MEDFIWCNQCIGTSTDGNYTCLHIYAVIDNKSWFKKAYIAYLEIIILKNGEKCTVYSVKHTKVRIGAKSSGSINWTIMGII